MKYVLDANVALKWVLAEPDSTKALQLRRDFLLAIHELVAPDFFEIEIAHALTRAERQGKIAIGQAAILWSDVLSTPPRLERFGPLVSDAITISSQFRHGVYDCLYIVLAARENCELVTADDKPLKKLQPHFPFIISLASLP